MTACTGKPPDGGEDSEAGPTGPVDEDGDGFLSDEDCDDRSEEVHPGATEVCDGVDNNCDLVVDEGVSSTWYADSDDDGFGDPNSTTLSCSRPEGYVPLPNDCDDGAASTYPGAPELCDGADQDCDDEIDEGVQDLFYVDSDGDGFGDPADTTESCEGLPGVSDEPTDCDDADAGVFPGADEHCNDRDDDCDGYADEAPTVEGSAWYPDADGDGFGDPDGTLMESCLGPAGYVENIEDCDDRDDAVNPDASEQCSNEVDDNCDGEVDEGCPIEHCGDVTEDETWSSDHEHIVTCDVSVGGTDHPVLTIEDGTVVYFVPGTGLYVGSGSPGALVVDGGAEGVLFTSTSDTPAPGDWNVLEIGYYDDGSTLSGFTLEGGGGEGYGAILVYASDATVSDCTITGSGSAGIYARVGATLGLADCAITDSADDGVTIAANSELTRFEGVTLSGNGGFPITLPASSLSLLDTSSSFTGNGDDRVQVTGDQVTSSGTWPDLGAPYYVVGDIEIEGTSTPTLSVTDGARFEFATGVGMTVGVSSRGVLRVSGETEGVVFTSAGDEEPGSWDGITFGPFDEGSSLEGALVQYGGGNGYAGLYVNSSDIDVERCEVSENDGAGIYVRSSATPGISETTLSNNEGYGLYVASDSGLASGTSFEDNIVTGNEDEGVVVPASAVASLDDSSSYTGNGAAGVRVLGGTIEEDATWQLLDEHYVVAGDVKVSDAGRPVLTLSAGLTVAFEPGAGFTVGDSNRGGLTAIGTRSAPVVLTSAQDSPAAGDWDGVTFGARCEDSDVTLTWTTVAWGGGNGLGNLVFDECDGTVSNATITGSAAWGIYRVDASPTLTSVSYSGNEAGDLY